jgi:hypothetical protein
MCEQMHPTAPPVGYYLETAHYPRTFVRIPETHPQQGLRMIFDFAGAKAALLDEINKGNVLARLLPVWIHLPTDLALVGTVAAAPPPPLTDGDDGISDDGTGGYIADAL